jgi:hypothetical protein
VGQIGQVALNIPFGHLLALLFRQRRAKLVENKIKNEILKKWITKELEGYDFDDPYLPDYRKVWSVVTLTAEFPFGRTQTFPVILSEDFGEKTIDFMNYHRIIDPIAIVEP